MEPRRLAYVRITGELLQEMFLTTSRPDHWVQVSGGLPADAKFVRFSIDESQGRCDILAVYEHESFGRTGRCWTGRCPTGHYGPPQEVRPEFSAVCVTVAEVQELHLAKMAKAGERHVGLPDGGGRAVDPDAAMKNLIREYSSQFPDDGKGGAFIGPRLDLIRLGEDYPPAGLSFKIREREGLPRPGDPYPSVSKPILPPLTATLRDWLREGDELVAANEIRRVLITEFEGWPTFNDRRPVGAKHSESLVEGKWILDPSEGAYGPEGVAYLLSQRWPGIKFEVGDPAADKSYLA